MCSSDLTRWEKPNPLSARLIAMSLSERGSPHGDRLLGKIYDHGGGVTRDPKLAAQWFLRAAEAGDAEAAAEMGLRYERGDGVARDLVEAYAWLLPAAAVRSTGAARRLDQLAPQLSEAERARAEALAEKRRITARVARELQLDEK